MKFEMQLNGLEGTLAMLNALPQEVVSKRGGPVRKALRRGAVVLLNEARSNLQAAIARADDADDKTSTGLLLKNLVVTRGKAPADGKGERYLVRVRRKQYADRKGEVVTTLKAAQLKEYGREDQPAAPWLRPAFAAKAEQAIRVVEADMLTSVNRAVAALAAKYRSR